MRGPARRVALRRYSERRSAGRRRSGSSSGGSAARLPEPRARFLPWLYGIFRVKIMQVAGKSKHFSQFAASRTAPSVVSGARHKPPGAEPQRHARRRVPAEHPARNSGSCPAACPAPKRSGSPAQWGTTSPAQGRSGTPPGEPPKTSRPAGSGVVPGSRMILSVLEPACDAFLRHGDGIPRKITKFARL